MDYLEVLLHPTLVMATIIYAIMAISFEIVYQHFLGKIASVSSTHWIAKHIGAPFFHVLLLVAFIYMSYPVLYGLHSHHNSGESILPSLTQLLNASDGQTMKLINTLFIVSVLLPLIPVINRFTSLILPLQAMTGSAVLYGWLANFTDINYSIFPGFKIVAIIILFSLIAEVAARALASLSAHSLKGPYHQSDTEKVIYKSILLIAQVPVLLIYTLNIAR
ncbi:MAG: hypothetical protein KZQ64_15405 [gamma proteobacterium symbiont of Bathyaustriella thionipta]|nr:hypothetical protein [gamma proteobacterium symbiont of Bathyaustriella thionipta]MCU7949617.1 hypothetical protein [gamma proteobacterium symbiont of Bathyaustriella thionipta]MCU7954755.1 hypothetical protein [gamma proteobacterium symbiont of Bathyaustriella thionipta]MCU7956595.1 hypothetical protein [gamma proteobacterium symbiont of Bathyaustriella thionipta]MCU7967911.1 hypothetical protein [gamma proteobacterium symbiont of Bathyaustriella thionipta]